MSLFRRACVDAPCTVEVEHSDERLCAHVELAGIAVNPGDRVRVQGPSISIPFGSRAVFDRTATIERAGPIARAWTRLAGHFELAELYEVSFTARRVP